MLGLELAGGTRGVRLESEFVGRKRRRGKGWGELDWNIGWLRVGLCIGERGAWARQGGGMEGEEMDLAENLLPI
jgi:hypothetical protein